eukprot:maker-scaffold575_size133042-snap-gene-0.40 protein:Tk10157 transcript:maker-scaffold575_size133042-snap-gene-0.40-mRNA-1 annotation:"Uncharacterized protein C4orf8"
MSTDSPTPDPPSSSWPGPELASAASLDHDDDLAEDELSEQERLLEELLRLRLHPGSDLSTSSSDASARSASDRPDPSAHLNGLAEQLGAMDEGSGLDRLAESDPEVDRLRQCWSSLKADLSQTYRMVLSGQWSEPSAARPELTSLKERIHELRWRDSHQLFQRLEGVVQEHVVLIKDRLLATLNDGASSPHLAQTFIQDLLDGFDNVCTAAQLVSPSMTDLEADHLSRFSLTWDVLNKHLYQALVYSDPVIQNNLPILISQLRSLFPEPDHEAKYTDLVRRYLDFDVEMENIGTFWHTSEILLLEYNEQQEKLRLKQKMLKDDWEKFKAQRREFEEEILAQGEALGFALDNGKGNGNEPGHKSDHHSHAGAEICECHVCQDLNKSQKRLHSRSGSLESAVLIERNSHAPSNGVPRAGDDAFANIYPHLYNSLADADKLLEKSNPKDPHASLASLFPSMLTAEGLKDVENNSAKVAELSSALKDALNITDPSPSDQGTEHKIRLSNGVQDNNPSSQKYQDVKEILKDITPGGDAKAAAKSTSSCPAPMKKGSCTTNNQPTKNTLTKAIACPKSKSSASCKANHHMGPHAKELNKLLNQHYCSHTKPSKSSSKKAKEAETPAGSGSSNISENVSDDDLDDEHLQDPEDEEEDDSSSDEHDSGDSRQCSCCYCEVFGHGGPSMAPVSRNYPEMRERLRFLLRKKKQSKHPAGERSSSAACQMHQESSNPVPERRGSSSDNDKRYQVVFKPTVETPVSPCPIEGTDDIPSKDVDEILDFIEGNVRTTSDKKKAKKERQKQQRFEEQRKKDEEERHWKKAQEAERNRKREEERKAEEIVQLTLKKQKKKAAQRAKKAAAKGVSTPEESEIDDRESLSLEELKMQQLREIQELKLMHQRQLQEEERKLQEILHEQQRLQTIASRAGSGTPDNPPFVRQPAGASHIGPGNGGPDPNQVGNSNPKKSKKKGGMNMPPPASAAQPPSSSMASRSTSLSSILQQAHGAKSSQQIKISRTPSGGVEFTPVVANEHHAALQPTSSTTHRSAATSQPPGPATHAPPSFSPFNHLMPSFPSMSSASITPAAAANPVGSNGTTYPNASNSSQDRPSVPSQASPALPMFTIKRIQTPDDGQPSATISLKDKRNEKLMYTFVNGEILRSKNAPTDLLPEARPMSDKKKKKKGANKPSVVVPTSEEYKAALAKAASGYYGDQGLGSRLSAVKLPLNAQGKVDLDKLDLPNGISITKIEGDIPDRKYFPSKPDLAVTSFPPRSNNFPSRPPASQDLAPEYINNPNVIVVDTSSLKTEAEEEAESLDAKSGNKAKRNISKGGSHEGDSRRPAGFPPSESPLTIGSVLNDSQSLAPEQKDSENSLKKGPQVLIRNINGKVVITPVPESQEGGDNGPTVNLHQEKKQSSPASKSPRKPEALLNGSGVKKIAKQESIGDNIDEISSVFTPKDIDLENGEMDEDEREVEAFKRFCFNHTPPQQKAKVHLDVKNIAFNKKK